MRREDGFLFLPRPRRLRYTEGTLAVEAHRLIALDAAHAHALRFTARKAQDALRAAFGVTWAITAGRGLPAERVGLTVLVMPQAVPHPQGYTLRVTPEGITIHAHDEAGAFYAVMTLAQLVEQVEGRAIPCLEIEDWPDFLARGVMLDISRDKVPTMETLFDLVDMLASWKVNQFQLYTEHTFAYQNHPTVWAHASPITGEEVMALDAYCRERYIELVPNQNSFGHMRRWLKHPEYAHLAEVHGPFEVPWGTMEGPFSLAPVEPGSLELMRSLYDELLPHFTSRMFNVGCDETFDLGKGKSKALCEARGVGRVYLDFLLELYREVTRRGYRMQFWGDIIIRYPDLVPELPRDLIALEWGYEADHPFDEHGARFAAAGVPFYVCPGTSSWNTIAGRTDNAIGNLWNAAENGLKHGAVGYLNTDWGDRGHWQYYPISFLGFGVGAAYAWAAEANRHLDVAAAISRFAFRDPTGAMGRVAYDLGNVYRVPGLKLHNSSPLFWILQGHRQRVEGLSADDFRRTLEAIDRAMAPLAEAQMARPDADLIKREFTNAAQLLRHACRAAIAYLEGDTAAHGDLRAELEALIEEHKSLWLARSRPGGLEDSLKLFDPLRESYGG